jgi:hypothetical protein
LANATEQKARIDPTQKDTTSSAVIESKKIPKYEKEKEKEEDEDKQSGARGDPHLSGSYRGSDVVIFNFRPS